jgi:diaminohydroxyphosphoribosylaminopyrimidine deaminase/5-amino-6-(5-phosphoribosylamino)uracil reductase
MATVNHQQFMARAITLGQRGVYTTSPNPNVGCVIVKDGRIVGEGWTAPAGGPHAEINALRAAGEKARSATAYVTLEPCSHHGKTPPCAEALVEAGIGRVVYGMIDPNPQVSGRGLDCLRNANIDVVGPVMADQCEALYPGFCKRMRTGMPRVTIKLAMSVDGRTAMASGESQWITGSAARQDVQRLRARSCAIITGIGTVLEDNPSMTVRAEELGDSVMSHQALIRQPLRVIVDSNGKLPSDAKIVTLPSNVLAVTCGEQSLAVDSISLPAETGKVDLLALLKELGRRECNDVLVEAGAKLAGAFVELGLADELVIYMAPKLLGSNARPLINLPLDNMAEQVSLDIQDIRMVGDDIRITAKPK